MLQLRPVKTRSLGTLPKVFIYLGRLLGFATFSLFVTSCGGPMSANLSYKYSDPTSGKPTPIRPANITDDDRFQLIQVSFEEPVITVIQEKKTLEFTLTLVKNNIRTKHKLSGTWNDEYIAEEMVEDESTATDKTLMKAQAKCLFEGRPADKKCSELYLNFYFTHDGQVYKKQFAALVGGDLLPIEAQPASTSGGSPKTPPTSGPKKNPTGAGSGTPSSTGAKGSKPPAVAPTPPASAAGAPSAGNAGATSKPSDPNRVLAPVTPAKKTNTADKGNPAQANPSGPSGRAQNASDEAQKKDKGTQDEGDNGDGEEAEEGTELRAH